MRTAGVIAEYNPFHKGHKFQLQQTRSVGDATHIVAVMSGHFVQRGDLSICSKWARTRMALMNGVDLVVELPVPWAMATAQQFADGAVQVLSGLGVVDMLSFGSECGSVDALRKAATAADDTQVVEKMREGLDIGKTFAAARAVAVEELYGRQTAEILSNPNDTLAVEYIRAASKYSPQTGLFAVKREGAMHDGLPEEGIASASHIRTLLSERDFDTARSFMPESAYEILREETEHGLAPVLLSTLETAILSRLRMLEREDFARLFDISEGLENRIYAAVREAVSLDSLYMLIKSKRYTHARIRRLILSAFLEIDADVYSRPVPYIRVLGHNDRGREILRAAKKKANVPVILKSSDVFSLDKHTQKVYIMECRATDLFSLAFPKKQKCGMEYTANIIKF